MKLVSAAIVFQNSLGYPVSGSMFTKGVGRLLRTKDHSAVIIMGKKIKAYLALSVSAFFLVGWNQATFQSGGSFQMPHGFVGMPAVVHNPTSSGVMAQFPIMAPQGKSLMVTDLFLETDPLDEPFLMILFLESPDKVISTLRTLHLRRPGHAYASMNTPIAIPSGWLLHVAFSNSASTPQSVNWGVNGLILDGDPRGALVSGTAGQKPEQWVAQPAPFVGDGFGVQNELAPFRIRGGHLYVDRGDGEAAWRALYGTADHVIVADDLPPCEDLSEVYLISPIREKHDIDNCIEGQIGLTREGLRPGQVFQVR